MAGTVLPPYIHRIASLAFTRAVVAEMLEATAWPGFDPAHTSLRGA